MVSTVAMSQRGNLAPRAFRDPSCECEHALAAARERWRQADSRNRRIIIASQQYIKLYDQNILYIYEQNIKVRTRTCIMQQLILCDGRNTPPAAVGRVGRSGRPEAALWPRPVLVVA